MKKTGLLAMLVCLATSLTAQTTSGPDLSHLQETRYSLEEVLDWTFTGIGKCYNEAGRQLCLQEDENSQGVGIFTPQPYKGDVVLRYKVMPLNAATVLVGLVCMSDPGESLSLNLPADYDGSMGPILENDNYFIAFRNSPHATAPFINKNPKGGQLVIAEKDELIPGVYYDVEIGRVGNTLWLKIDDKTVVKCEDPDILAGGHLGIRIRGLVGHPAACVLRDVSILSE